MFILDFKIAVHTDVGIRKEQNQDSILVKTARTNCGRVLLAAVCDGMGGFAKGELASGILVRMLDNWFSKELPSLIAKGLTAGLLWKSWNVLIQQANNRIFDYGQKKHIRLGTTLTALLLTEHGYFTVNVGDSRIYQFHNGLERLTKDQTFVQREVDLGRMTEQEARKDSRRNILLQCIGAAPLAEPVFDTGTLEQNSLFLLCSDGFRHEVSEEELYENLRSGCRLREREMKEKLVYLTELNKARNEPDNISAVLISATERRSHASDRIFGGRKIPYSK